MRTFKPPEVIRDGENVLIELVAGRERFATRADITLANKDIRKIFSDGITVIAYGGIAQDKIVGKVVTKTTV